MKKKRISYLLAACMTICLFFSVALTACASYEKSALIEKEQPELTEETKQLISLYQKSPTEENYLNLRDVVIKNYNAVLARKEGKAVRICGARPRASRAVRKSSLKWKKSSGYEDVGFRVIQVLHGKEPEQKVELATLGGRLL